MTDAKTDWRSYWLKMAGRCQDRLAEAGLEEMAQAVVSGLRPLAPVAGQLLHIIQPAFRPFEQTQAVDALAGLLNDTGRCPGSDRLSSHHEGGEKCPD